MSLIDASSAEEAVTLAWRSPGLDASAVDCVVTVPTFRRPDHLVRTLDSIARQRGVRGVAVIVMENDAEGGAGAAAAEAILGTTGLVGDVVIAHRRGNCHAYNAGWTWALSHFPGAASIAVIDDDEIADPGWLDALGRVRSQTGADIVGGPQRPVFDDAAAGRMAGHPVFRPPYAGSGPVPVLYSSGNVLIARRVLEAMPRPFLDPAFNFIGGGASDFYRRCRNAGFRFAWAADAVVHETTPARRTETSWLTARSLRNGAISALLEHRQYPGAKGRLRVLAKSAALLAASLPRGVRLAGESRSALIGLYHLQVALGRLQAEFGSVGEQYRNPEAN